MISVYTPCHNTKWIQRTYQSLLNQTYTDWEWVVYLNGEALGQDISFLSDPRVKKFKGDATGNVAIVKTAAVALSTGDWIIELDHDDELTPDCLERIVASAQNVDFIYSNAAVCSNEQDTEPPYSKAYGWQYRNIVWRGLNLPELISPSIHPANLGLIYYAPDHVRAYRRAFYDKLGGYNVSLKVGDDHDLLCRMYLAGGRIHHIDKCLYIYHVHGENTWLKYNAEVQATQWDNHYKYLPALSEYWAKQQRLRLVDLGGGIDKAEGYESYDSRNGDIVGDLNETWQLEDNSVGVLRAHDILEHLRNPIHAMNEAYRVLAPNGMFLISVPDARGQGGFCDPTHVSFWVPRSFRYYTEPNMQRYIPESICKFQEISLRELEKWDDKVPYIEANLLACKDKQRIHGVCNWL